MAVQPAVINVMQAAARKAARRLVRDFGELENLQVSRKGPAEFVTSADIRTDKILQEELGAVRPDIGFLTEESGDLGGGDGGKRWIINPIDGTTNFMHGLPFFAVSIGYEDAGTLTAGVIYAPITDEMFWAYKGEGAYLNHTRLRVAGRNRLEDAVIGTGIPHIGRPDNPHYLAELGAMMQNTAGIRRFGAAALDLAYVAAGRLDGFWEHGLSAWDIAAGIVIAREAGAIVSRHDGGNDPLRDGSVLAANDALHGRMLRLLRAAKKAENGA